MRPDFRMVVANGDLILQQKQRKGWWFLGDKSEWVPFRNLSEEERCMKEHMDNAFMHYKNMQRLYVIAQKNVSTDIEKIQVHKFDNSEVEYLVPSDFSILEEREGIKYSFSRGNGGSGGSGKGNNQNNNGNGNNQQQSNKQKKAQNKPMSVMDMLMNAKIVMPNNQQQAS